MAILVTGANGQLGRELCRQIGDVAHGVDVNSLDLTNRDLLLRYTSAQKPEAVLNCAAYTQVDRAESEPEKCWAINATAVEYLVEACQIVDCPLMQISTDYVFGGTRSPYRPWRESEPTSPQGIYAQSKLAGEQAAARLPQHLVVRTCGLYARPSDDRATNFVRTMLRLGNTQSELRVVNDQHCTPTYVPHLAQALWFLLKAAVAKNLWGTYHITNQGEATWHQFASEVFRLADMNVSVLPITSAEYGALAPRPSYSVLDTAAYHAVGGPVMPTWQQALADYFQEARQS